MSSAVQSWLGRINSELEILIQSELSEHAPIPFSSVYTDTKPELPWTHHGLLALGSLDRVATLEVDGLLRDLQALFPLRSS